MAEDAAQYLERVEKERCPNGHRTYGNGPQDCEKCQQDKRYNEQLENQNKQVENCRRDVEERARANSIHEAHMSEWLKNQREDMDATSKRHDENIAAAIQQNEQLRRIAIALESLAEAAGKVK